MQITSEALERAIEELTRLPGTGRKSAQRMAIYLLKQKDEKVFALAEALVQLKKSVVRCSECGTITEQDPCTICINPKRNAGVICVVEEFQDVYLIEKTNEFNGLYHVLGGSISPLENIGPDDLRIRELLERVSRSESGGGRGGERGGEHVQGHKSENSQDISGSKEGRSWNAEAEMGSEGKQMYGHAEADLLNDGSVREIILALNPDAEGEATSYYIHKLLQPYDVKVTRIAYGIPMGTELEYIDEATLSRAFAGRTSL